MDIYNIIDIALGTVAEYYYHGMPEFEEGEEPAKYAVYSVRELPANFATGNAHADSYFVPVSIFTPTVDTAYKSGIIVAMENAGGIYQGGEDVSYGTDYPYKKQYSMDFIFNIDRKDDN